MMIVSYDIQQLAEFVGGEILGSPNTKIHILSTDSRSLPHSDGLRRIRNKTGALRIKVSV